MTLCLLLRFFLDSYCIRVSRIKEANKFVEQLPFEKFAAEYVKINAMEEYFFNEENKSKLIGFLFAKEMSGFVKREVAKGSTLSKESILVDFDQVLVRERIRGDVKRNLEEFCDFILDDCVQREYDDFIKDNILYAYISVDVGFKIAHLVLCGVCNSLLAAVSFFVVSIGKYKH